MELYWRIKDPHKYCNKKYNYTSIAPWIYLDYLESSPILESSFVDHQLAK